MPPMRLIMSLSAWELKRNGFEIKDKNMIKQAR